jgi:hypothetical protein
LHVCTSRFLIRKPWFCFQVQLTKVCDLLQEEIKRTARFDLRSSLKTMAEPIRSSSTSVDATHSAISDRPIQTQILQKLLWNIQASSPRLRRYSLLFDSGMFVLFTISAKAVRWTGELLPLLAIWYLQRVPSKRGISRSTV